MIGFIGAMQIELDGIRDLVQVHMSRYDLVIGANDANEGLLQLLGGQPERIIERSVRRIIAAVHNGIFNHGNSLLQCGKLLYGAHEPWLVCHYGNLRFLPRMIRAFGGSKPPPYEAEIA